MSSSPNYNKYLKKLASMPVEEYAHVEELTIEQLREIFRNFKVLPGDSPIGQPGTVVKFVRTELRE